METTHKLFDLLWSVLEQLPSLVTILACMIFAATRWKRYRMVSVVALAGLFLLFLHGPIFAVVFNWVPDLFITPGSYVTAPNTRRNVFLVLGLIYNTALAIAFAVLLAGIFMQRSPAKEET